MTGTLSLNLRDYPLVLGVNIIPEEIFKRIEFAFKSNKALYIDYMEINGDIHKGFAYLNSDTDDSYYTQFATIGGGIYELNTYHNGTNYIINVYLYQHTN